MNPVAIVESQVSGGTAAADAVVEHAGRAGKAKGGRGEEMAGSLEIAGKFSSAMNSALSSGAGAAVTDVDVARSATPVAIQNESRAQGQATDPINQAIQTGRTEQMDQASPINQKSGSRDELDRYVIHSDPETELLTEASAPFGDSAMDGAQFSIRTVSDAGSAASSEHANGSSVQVMLPQIENMKTSHAAARAESEDTVNFGESARSAAERISSQAASVSATTAVQAKHGRGTVESRASDSRHAHGISAQTVSLSSDISFALLPPPALHPAAQPASPIEQGRGPEPLSSRNKAIVTGFPLISSQVETSAAHSFVRTQLGGRSSSVQARVPTAVTPAKGTVVNPDMAWSGMQTVGTQKLVTAAEVRIGESTRERSGAGVSPVHASPNQTSVELTGLSVAFASAGSKGSNTGTVQSDLPTAIDTAKAMSSGDRNANSISSAGIKSILQVSSGGPALAVKTAVLDRAGDSSFRPEATTDSSRANFSQAGFSLAEQGLSSTVPSFATQAQAPALLSIEGKPAHGMPDPVSEKGTPPAAVQDAKLSPAVVSPVSRIAIVPAVYQTSKGSLISNRSETESESHEHAPSREVGKEGADFRSAAAAPAAAVSRVYGAMAPLPGGSSVHSAALDAVSHPLSAQGQLRTDPFQAIDLGGNNSPGSPAQHPSAGAVQQIQVGYQDPDLGYIELRAHSDGSGIHASLGTQSPAAGEALEAHRASLTGWLNERNTPVESLTVVAIDARSDGRSEARMDLRPALPEGNSGFMALGGNEGSSGNHAGDGNRGDAQVTSRDSSLIAEPVAKSLSIGTAMSFSSDAAGVSFAPGIPVGSNISVLA